jgi:hypothetical protein
MLSNLEAIFMRKALVRAFTTYLSEGLGNIPGLRGCIWYEVVSSHVLGGNYA